MVDELTWHDVLVRKKQQPCFPNTPQTVASRRQSDATIYPPQKDIFNAFRFTKLGDVKVVILGQDSHHGSGQARSLAFSVRPGIATPPSLLNICKELENTIPGFTRPNRGYLESWARQGVLLLNTVLTVRASQARSYVSLGWETSTDKIISLINWHRKGVVFLLWESHAQREGTAIDKQCHHILKTSHPSPLSTHRGLFDCNHLVLANQWLEQRGGTPIDQMPVLPAENE